MNFEQEANKNYSNDNGDSSQDPNSSALRNKRKRRSKNDYDGRDFVCEICGNAYLSLPALTNHKKMKHETEKLVEKRGRGRPRKSVQL